jgi:hypothetical protein
MLLALNFGLMIEIKLMFYFSKDYNINIMFIFNKI